METAATHGDLATLAAEARKIADAADQWLPRLRDCAHRIELASASGDFRKSSATGISAARRAIAGRADYGTSRRVESPHAHAGGSHS